MLFRGVQENEAFAWEVARGRANEIDWPQVVGVHLEAWNASLFGVLEWGAMEVSGAVGRIH